MFYLSLDVEASGPVPGLYSLVSIGCVPVFPPSGPEKKWRVGSDRTFYAELQPLPEGADLPAANEVHGLTRAHLSEHGEAPEAAMRRMAAYLAELRRSQPKYMLAAWPASFDHPYISYYAHRFLGENPFGYGALDIASLAQGVLRCPRRELRSRLAAAKLKREPKPYPHNALDDAAEQAGFLCKLLNLSAWMARRSKGSEPASTEVYPTAEEIEG